MLDSLDHLKQLISAPGISGYESSVRSLIESAWKPLSDALSVSKLGSLHALQQGTAPEPRPAIMVAAHMDAIGLLVSAIVDGFLRVTSVGDIDARVLPGQLVTVHGKQDLPGLVVASPARLLPYHLRGGSVPLEYLLVDLGLEPGDVTEMVKVGDPISFAQPPIETAGETLAGHTLDNRASVVALTHCLEILRQRAHSWDVWAVATTHEEVTYGGGMTSAFQLQPQLCVSIDTTFATEPNSPDHLTFPMGKGPTLMWGPVVHPYLHTVFSQLAKTLEIPLSVEVSPSPTGTDSYVMQVTAEGIPNVVIGIPLRYMHTPVEMVALKDVTRAGRLVAEFIAQLDIGFMDRLVWED